MSGKYGIDINQVAIWHVSKKFLTSKPIWAKISV